MAGNRFEEDSPILVDTPIVDKSRGKLLISKALGGVSETIADTAVKMGEAESNLMYAHSQAQIDTLKTNAKIEMIKNPGNAGRIADHMAQEYSNITDAAVVNDADRRRLKTSAMQDYNQLRVDAAHAEVDTAKRHAAIEFYQTYPQLLSSIVKNAGNETEFNARVKSAQDLASRMFESGIIEARQYDTAMKSLNGSIARSQAYLRASGGNTSSREYHRIKSGVLPVDDGTHLGQPVDHNTAQIYDAHADDLSVSSLKANIANGEPGNPETWSKLSDAKLAMFDAYSQGAHSVYADLKNGTPIFDLEHENEQYKNRPLSSGEQGRHDAINVIKGKIERGGLQQLLNDNPLMRELDYNYNVSMAAVNKEPDVNRRYEMTRNYTNELYYRRAAVAEAMHFPGYQINPLDAQFIANTQKGFFPNQDPMNLITNVDYLEQPLKEYAARAQSDPLKQEATRIVANTKDAILKGFWGNTKATDADRVDWIQSFKQHDFKDLKQEHSNGTTDAQIMTKMQGKIVDPLLYIKNQHDGLNRTSAISKLTLQYIKYLAQKNGDYNLDNLDDYIDKAGKMINAAYPVMKGATWKINPKDVPYDASEMDTIAYRAKQNAIDLLAKEIGINNVRARIDSNSLSVTSSADGYIVVVDGYGNRITETKATPRLYHFSRSFMQNSPSQPKPKPEVTNEEVDQDIVDTEKMRERGRKAGKKYRQLVENKNG